MLCSYCNNILEKTTESGVLKFNCGTCGSQFESKGEDSLISNDDKQIFHLIKNGRTIWFYPSNQKVFKACIKCKSKIVAFEVDSQMNKIYGCSCGYSWKEDIQSS